MTDDTAPGPPAAVVGGLLDSAPAAHEEQNHLELTRLWRRAVAAIAARTGLTSATRRALAEQLAAECFDDATTTDDASADRPGSLSPDRLATTLMSALHCEIELGRHERARRCADRLRNVLDPRSGTAGISVRTRAPALEALEAFAASTTPT